MTFYRGGYIFTESKIAVTPAHGNAFDTKSVSRTVRKKISKTTNDYARCFNVGVNRDPPPPPGRHCMFLLIFRLYHVTLFFFPTTNGISRAPLIEYGSWKSSRHHVRVCRTQARRQGEEIKNSPRGPAFLRLPGNLRLHNFFKLKK